MTPAVPLPPGKALGHVIHKARKALNLTQDEYAARYGVSGPAVYKYEKGSIRPSLQLWLKMALDAKLSERRAILLWIKTKLPEKYHRYIH